MSTEEDCHQNLHYANSEVDLDDLFKHRDMEENQWEGS